MGGSSKKYRGWRPVIALACACASLFFLSCAPDTGFNTVESTDLVLTIYDSNFNYATLSTYAMPDSVMHIYDPENPPDDDEINREYDELILTTVENDMKAFGYVEESNPAQDTADVYVVVAVTTTEYTGVGWAPGSGYWWGYPGWGWGPGWGWYYPPGYYYQYNFSTGTILVSFWDGKASTDETIVVRWSAALNGLLSSSSSGTANRITRGINQAFEQSPYLKQTQ
jgi:hypothetical protein